MKKITIINGEFHEEEMDAPSPKVVENHNIPPYPGTDGTSGTLIFGGTGGGMSRFDSDEFRRMWYEPFNHFQRERESDERLRNVFRETMSAPERTLTQIWEESGPTPTVRIPITGDIVRTPDDTVTSLALAMRSSTSAMTAMVNSYRGGAYPLSGLTEGIGSTSSEQRQFAILWTNAQAIADRMFNQLATGTPDFWDRTEEEHGRGL